MLSPTSFAIKSFILLANGQGYPIGVPFWIQLCNAFKYSRLLSYHLKICGSRTVVLCLHTSDYPYFHKQLLPIRSRLAHVAASLLASNHSRLKYTQHSPFIHVIWRTHGFHCSLKYTTKKSKKKHCIEVFHVQCF